MRGSKIDSCWMTMMSGVSGRARRYGRASAAADRRRCRSGRDRRNCRQESGSSSEAMKLEKKQRRSAAIRWKATAPPPAPVGRRPDRCRATPKRRIWNPEKPAAPACIEDDRDRGQNEREGAGENGRYGERILHEEKRHRSRKHQRQIRHDQFQPAMPVLDARRSEDGRCQDGRQQDRSFEIGNGEQQHRGARSTARQPPA